MIKTYFNAVAKSIKKKVDEDGYTDPVLEEIATDVECRKLQVDKLKQDDKGNELKSSIEVWLPENIDRLPAQSEIVFDKKKYKVISSKFATGITDKIFQRVHLE